VFFRLFALSLQQMDACHAELGRSVVGSEGERVIESRDRIGILSELRANETDQVMGVRIGRVQVDDALEWSHGMGRHSEVAVRQPQVVPRARSLGIFGRERLQYRQRVVEPLQVEQCDGPVQARRLEGRVGADGLHKQLQRRLGPLLRHVSDAERVQADSLDPRVCDFLRADCLCPVAGPHQSERGGNPDPNDHGTASVHGVFFRFGERRRTSKPMPSTMAIIRPAGMRFSQASLTGESRAPLANRHVIGSRS
jgi:hypothetical protein